MARTLWRVAKKGGARYGQNALRNVVLEPEHVASELSLCHAPIKAQAARDVHGRCVGDEVHAPRRPVAERPQ